MLGIKRSPLSAAKRFLQGCVDSPFRVPMKRLTAANRSLTGAYFRLFSSYLLPIIVIRRCQ